MKKRRFVARLTGAGVIAAACLASLSAWSGTATLTATAPTTNQDGTPLEDLASYRIRWGCRQSGHYEHIDTFPAAGNLVRSLDDLPDFGTCYFTATAIDASGNESSFSNEASKVMGPPREPDPRPDPRPSQRPNQRPDQRPGTRPEPVSRAGGDPAASGFAYIVCPDPNATDYPSCPESTWVNAESVEPNSMVFFTTSFSGSYKPPGPTENNHLSGPGVTGTRGWRPYDEVPRNAWIAVRIDGWIHYENK